MDTIMKSNHRIVMNTIVLTLPVILPIGCSKDPPTPWFIGHWEGSMKEGNQTIRFDLIIHDVDGSGLKGIFNITAKDGQPWNQTAPQEIRNVEATEFTIKFTVPNPQTGTIDDDALIMNLELQDEHLVGRYRKRKSPPSQSTRITLRKSPLLPKDPNRSLPPIA
jgi:hypothetical protein